MKTHSVTPNRTSTAPAQAEARQESLRPRVDVHEDAGGITLYADLPGVASDQLEVHVDKDTLRIRGEAKLEMPDGMEPLYAELRSPAWSRSFALSSELDAGAIEAKLRDGVLELRIPKRAEVRPRKIDVRVS
jgi:HSP20 family protein